MDENKKALDDENLNEEEPEKDNAEDENIQAQTDAEFDGENESSAEDEPEEDAESAGKSSKPTAQSLNEELKEFNKEHGVTLDSPLVVHKKSDVSYEESTDAYEMTETHTGEERPTLKRHRFKKEKKKKKSPYVIIAVIVVLAAVFAGLYYTGNITFGPKKTTEKQTTVSTTENLLEKYKGTIVVKNTYIFVDGREVDGIEGLQNALKYVDPSPTAYEIIVEDENKEFLNYEVLALLESMGFFTDDTTVTHVDTTGLVAREETTAPTSAQNEVVTQASTAPQTQPSTAAQTQPGTTAAPAQTQATTAQPVQ